MSDFRGVDFSSLEKISFTFENGDANLLQEMELLIDDIAFLKRDTFTYGTIALSVGTLYMNEMERLTEDSLGNLVRLNSTFGAQNYSFMLSYANNVNVAGIDLKLGLTGKFLLQQIGTVTDRQFMSDFGMMYADKEGVYSLGVVFQNISGLGDVFSAKGGGPFNVNVGTGGRLFKKNLFLAFCMNFPKTGVPTVSAGIEYRLFGFLFPRVGYEFMNDMINFSAGLGTTYKTYQFDYALSVTRESVIIHRLAISYKI